MAAAADENREDLQDIWAGLLAAAMNPSRSNQVPLAFSGALQKLDPLDARVMTFLYARTGRINAANDERALVARDMNVSRDELEVSLQNLIDARFMANQNNAAVVLTPFCREFLRAISD